MDLPKVVEVIAREVLRVSSAAVADQVGCHCLVSVVAWHQYLEGIVVVTTAQEHYQEVKKLVHFSSTLVVSAARFIKGSLSYSDSVEAQAAAG